MRVYHFLAEKWAKEALSKKRLRVSMIDQLNDPFEFCAGFSKPTAKIKKTFRVWKTNISKEFGILCFSKKWTNPLLWSHYAKRHTGFALGFDISDNVTEVIYTKDRPLFIWDRIPPPEHSQLFLDKLIKTKFMSWRYEEEVRTFYELNTLDYESGHYFNKFDDNLILKEVIAGCNSPLSDRQFREMLDGYKNIVAIKSRMAFKSFKIVRNRQKVWKLND